MSCAGLSFTELRDRSYRRSFAAAGLKSSTTDFGDGTTMHCWVPAQPSPARPAVVLLHGFGANATWQWGDLLRPLLRARLNVYVPDLLFFGASFTALPHRTVSFQARCVARLMDSLGVRRASVAGISYGGFVAYCMAVQSPEKMEKLVICCSGVCLEERDLKEGLFPVKDLDEAASILVPQSPARLRRLIRLSFVRPPMALPSCFLADFIDVMCREYVQEKKELIQSVLKERSCSDLPKITQPTLIIWGEQDKIFPIELAYRLKRHLDQNSRLVTIKKAGHALNLEKPKEFSKHLKEYLIDSSSAMNHKVDR